MDGRQGSSRLKGLYTVGGKTDEIRDELGDSARRGDYSVL